MKNSSFGRMNNNHSITVQIAIYLDHALFLAFTLNFFSAMPLYGLIH